MGQADHEQTVVVNCWVGDFEEQFSNPFAASFTSFSDSHPYYPSL